MIKIIIFCLNKVIGLSGYKLEYNIDIDEKKGCFCIENDLDYIIYLPKC